MNYKELSKVVDLTTKVKDSDNTFESEMEVLTNELWEAEGKVKYPEHWTEDQKLKFDIAFEDFQLDDNPENIKFRSDGEYVWLEWDEEIEDPTNEVKDSEDETSIEVLPHHKEFIDGLQNLGYKLVGTEYPEDTDNIVIYRFDQYLKNDDVYESEELYADGYLDEFADDYVAMFKE